MKKELAVFTIDHANFHEVANVAADMQVNAQMYFPKDHSPNGATIAELYDLDHWVSTAHDRDQLIAELAASPRRLPTGVHSYNMSDAQVGTRDAPRRKHPRGQDFLKRARPSIILASSCARPCLDAERRGSTRVSTDFLSE